MLKKTQELTLNLSLCRAAGYSTLFLFENRSWIAFESTSKHFLKLFQRDTVISSVVQNIVFLWADF